MKRSRHAPLLGLVLLMGIAIGQVFVRAESAAPTDENNQLAVVWSSGDSEVAHKVCFMYTQAAKGAGWFDDVTLIIWGPSSRLLAGDKELQSKIKAMIDSGVNVQACVVCADMYGVAETLRQMGITVRGMGQPLSDMLKSDTKVLTF
jgi:hypothetical protein